MATVWRYDLKGNFLGEIDREIPEGFEEILIVKYDKPNVGGRFWGFGSDETDPPGSPGEARWNTPGWNGFVKPYHYNFLGDLFPFGDIEKMGKIAQRIPGAR